MMLIIFLRSVCCFCVFFRFGWHLCSKHIPNRLEEGYLFTGVILKKLMVRVEDYFAS